MNFHCIVFQNLVSKVYTFSSSFVVIYHFVLITLNNVKTVMFLHKLKKPKTQNSGSFSAKAISDSRAHTVKVT